MPADRARFRRRPERRRRVLAVAILVAASIGTGCGGGAGGRSHGQLVACGESTTVQYSHHDGVPAGLNSLDVYMPPADDDGDCSERPLVVWIHGGGWTAGDKTDDIEHKVRLFNDAGFVLASINYRLTDPESDPPAPQHPVHDQDSADAVAWLIDNAKRLGVDPGRVAVLGHSAGGGIAAAITTDGTYLGRHGLDVDSIRCAGSVDGEGYDVVAGATHPDPNRSKTYLNVFGTDPAVWPGASPINHVMPAAGIPDYFVAARGVDVRLDQHAEFVAALHEAGIPVTVVDARALDHAEVSVNIGAPDDTVVTPVLMEFLQGCFVEPRTKAAPGP